MKTADLLTIRDRVNIAELIRAAGLKQSTIYGALGYAGREPRELKTQEKHLLRIQIRKLRQDLDQMLMK